MRRYIPLENLTILEKIIATILKKYTYKIYRQGLINGFNWRKK